MRHNARSDNLCSILVYEQSEALQMKVARDDPFRKISQLAQPSGSRRSICTGFEPENMERLYLFFGQDGRIAKGAGQNVGLDISSNHLSYNSILVDTRPLF
jgi:hypothetical protein